MARLPPPAAEGASEAASSPASWMQSGVSGVARGCCAVSAWRSLTAQQKRGGRSRKGHPPPGQSLCSVSWQGLHPGNKQSSAGQRGNETVTARQVLTPTGLGCSGQHPAAYLT